MTYEKQYSLIQYCAALLLKHYSRSLKTNKFGFENQWLLEIKTLSLLSLNTYFIYIRCYKISKCKQINCESIYTITYVTNFDGHCVDIERCIYKHDFEFI